MTDICLILEGTYPFTAGGVSTWIHQLISAMPDMRFSILHISPFHNPHREYKYRLPANVVDISDLYLHDVDEEARPSPAGLRRKAFAELGAFHEQILAGRWDALGEALPLLRAPGRAVNFPDVFRSEESWDLQLRFYKEYAGDASFLDYFWTFRSIYAPLLKTLQCPIPRARLYHTVSTGYAGVLASVAKLTHDAGMLLTEHGVYTHERLLEISQANWIYTPHRERFRVQRELSYFKRFWLGFFDIMGKLTYHHADRIVTLFEGNRTKQILAGAPPEKISIIPNGIDLGKNRDPIARRPAAGRKTVAFIGRVVNIKDVKTFIHASKIVADARPDVDFFILGPLNEEKEYAQECVGLISGLGLESRIVMPGKVDLREWYPRIDLVVLTSLSEAQPYAILEANAAGIPVVASDVGACRELLEGRGRDDRRIGPSGLLTGVSNPQETGAAVLKLLADQALWNAMAEAGRNRTMRFYDQDDLISKYLNLYEQMMR